MNFEEMDKLITNIIDNEYLHVSKYEEDGFIKTDEEQRELEKNREELLKKVLGIKKGDKHWQLIDDFDCAAIRASSNLNKFYFRMGVKAALTNLKFLNDIAIEELL